MMDSESIIQIKGIREGLLISAQNGSWEDRKQQIAELVHEKESFFYGARVCLDVGDTLLRVKEITALRDQLADAQITLWAILSQSQATINNAQALGLAIHLPEKKENKKTEENHEDAGEKAVFVNRTLRAGYRVEAKEHVIVFGDVNPGAEIITAGSIIVWGKLKGSAFAGVEGNAKVRVCALELTPNLLKIGEVVFPPRQRKGKPFPEVAYVENNECIIENWKNEKEK